MFPCTDEKAATVTGWQDYKGKCSTPVYGIAVPEGYVVIDMDLYKNDNLIKEVNDFLGVELDWDGSLIQTTQRGGTHHAFETDEVIKQGVDIKDKDGEKIKGFDIRSAGKGYICSGKGYSENLTDDIFSFLPELPTGLPIVNTHTNTHSYSDSFYDDDLGDFEGLLNSDVDTDKVKALLAEIDNNIGNDDWVKVGMAIHSELPSEEGLTLWDEWSKGGQTYKDGQCLKRWNGFKQGGSVTMGTLHHMAGHIAKVKTVVDYVIPKVIKDRIAKDYKRGAFGVSFEADVDVIKLILKNTYYTCASKTFFKMFNELGQVIRVGKNEIASTLIDNFGQPFTNYDELESAIDAENAVSTVSQTEKRKALAMPINTMIKLLLEFQQRERITQCVDIFADEAYMNIKPDEAIESLKYAPIIIEHEMYNEEVVKAYEGHFPELYEVLDMIIASRFATNRKKCYLWIKAESDWGKDLFRGCLGERAMEISVAQIGKAIKGETVSVQPHEIVGTFAMCVNEFSNINSELKQIEDKIIIAPKYFNQATIPTYAKIFFSADDVDSLVGEHGVEAQFGNRFSMLSYTGLINDLAIFHEVKQYKFTHVLKTHIGNYINKQVEEYRVMGREEASVKGDDVTSAFHKNHSIAKEVGGLDSNIKSLANTVARAIIVSNDSEFKAIHDGVPVYTRARTLIHEILFKIGGKSESVKLCQQWKKVLSEMSEDGVKPYLIDGKTVKGFKLDCEKSDISEDDF